MVEYPDSGRIAVEVVNGNDKQPPKVFSIDGRVTPLGYWNGEDVDKTDG
ncbi:hypothetical protein HB779_22390 (plasmid) [Phyllobacterium sp. 628]|nr:hypothetical protein [Phyllobacterium sp. 628]QND54644.1 hypothetical protein HB779_22390 [Phyllobacterium sp. 628]